MPWQRKKRFILIGIILCSAAVAIFLATYALNQNINLYFTPTQIAAGLAPEGHAVRLGGIVKAGSIRYGEKGAQLHFILTDTKHDIPVVYAGVVPDLFGPKQGVVAQGKFKGDLFVANEVLAKHGAKYMPREVLESLQAVKQE